METLTQTFITNLTFFLLEKKGSTSGLWSGKMTAHDQRALFGRFIGKGRIVVDGYNQIIFNRVKVCFGLDYEDKNITRWSHL